MQQNEAHSEGGKTVHISFPPLWLSPLGLLKGSGINLPSIWLILLNGRQGEAIFLQQKYFEPAGLWAKGLQAGKSFEAIWKNVDGGIKVGIGWSDKERGTQRQDRMTRCKMCHRVQICWAKTESFLYYHSATFWGNKSNRKTHIYLGYFYTTSLEFCLKQLIIKTISKYQKQACKQKLTIKNWSNKTSN